MKKLVIILFMTSFTLAACGEKPKQRYETCSKNPRDYDCEIRNFDRMERVIKRY